MNNVVIIDAIRTPMGRSKDGAFRHVRAETLSAHLMRHLLSRNPNINPLEIDDIYWGCVQQTKEQGLNIARNAALLSGLPHTIPATTVNRLCGSSMQALHDAARAIMVQDAEICMVGGVEHMGHVPMNYNVDLHPNLSKYIAKASGVMGLTVEMLAKIHHVSRETQDSFAARSHQRAHQATLDGRFNQELIPTPGHDLDGGLFTLKQDEVIRPETNLVNLSTLKPAFDSRGSLTAGNSSAIADGASALLIMSENKAQSLNLSYQFKIKAMSITGCDPAIMGYGPVHAIQKLLKKTKLHLNDIDIFEFNEAFAAQTLSCLKALDLIDQIDQKINLNGGAIALGHPLGCSGARICTTLLHLMNHQKAHLGLAAMCIGLGQGICTLFERVDH